MTELRAQLCFLNNQNCPNFVNHSERCTPITLLGTTFDNSNRWKIRQCVPDVTQKYLTEIQTRFWFSTSLQHNVGNMPSFLQFVQNYTRFKKNNAELNTSCTCRLIFLACDQLIVIFLKLSSMQNPRCRLRRQSISFYSQRNMLCILLHIGRPSYIVLTFSNLDINSYKIMATANPV